MANPGIHFQSIIKTCTFSYIASCFCHACLIAVFSAGFAVAAAVNVADKNATLHARPWSFGHSADRHDVLWKKGLNGATLNKNKVSSPEQTKNAANTSGGINQALNQVEKDKVKSKLGVSLEQDLTTWSVAPSQKSSRADEEVAREKRHILRAYAGVESGDDFNINFGPELILKDEEHSAEAAISDQPDSALGLGMKFKYDF